MLVDCWFSTDCLLDLNQSSEIEIFVTCATTFAIITLGFLEACTTVISYKCLFLTNTPWHVCHTLRVIAFPRSHHFFYCTDIWSEMETIALLLYRTKVLFLCQGICSLISRILRKIFAEGLKFKSSLNLLLGSVEVMEVFCSNEE